MEGHNDSTKDTDVRPRTIGGKVLNLYKQMGETPAERLERLRMQKPEYAREVLSYAGRLDPMAEGVMITLVGSANKMREAYLDMSKEYVLDILFGFSTDTYDVLGRIMESGDTHEVSKKAVEQGLNEFRGHVSQEYPPYSSKAVEGKSLFEWARAGTIGALVLPRKTITVYDITLEGLYKIKEPALLAYIEHGIEKVHGDFRQEEILEGWKRALQKGGDREFPCATVKISCSSGTYARSIAHGLGQDLGVPALALHILRTKVGDYDASKSLK
jgi:tRNA pseudouridine55 synthase